MPTVEYFEHTADVGLRVEAPRLDDLFLGLARGLFGYVVSNPEAIRALDSEILSLQSSSLPDLAVAWLNELIFRLETRHRLYSRFELAVDPASSSLEATIWGEPIDPDRHELDHEVKAATHHGLTLEQTGVHWHAEIILDI